MKSKEKVKPFSWRKKSDAVGFFRGTRRGESERKVFGSLRGPNWEKELKGGGKGPGVLHSKEKFFSRASNTKGLDKKRLPKGCPP